MRPESVPSLPAIDSELRSGPAIVAVREAAASSRASSPVGRAVTARQAGAVDDARAGQVQAEVAERLARAARAVGGRAASVGARADGLQHHLGREVVGFLPIVRSSESMRGDASKAIGAAPAGARPARTLPETRTPALRSARSSAAAARVAERPLGLRDSVSADERRALLAQEARLPARRVAPGVPHRLVTDDAAGDALDAGRAHGPREARDVASRRASDRRRRRGTASRGRCRLPDGSPTAATAVCARRPGAELGERRDGGHELLVRGRDTTRRAP